VEDEIEHGGLLDREVARLRPAQDLVDVPDRTSEQVPGVWSVGHETSGN